MNSFYFYFINKVGFFARLQKCSMYFSSFNGWYLKYHIKLFAFMQQDACD